VRYIASCFLILLFFFYPQSLKAEDTKSLPVVIGTALSPIGIGVVGVALDYNVNNHIYGWGLLRFTPFAITTVPIISHSYLEDYSGGVKYLLIKGVGMSLLYTGEEYCGNIYCDLGTILAGGVIIVGTYIYEIVDLVKKTNEINKKADNKLSLGFYGGVNRNRYNLSLSLAF